jgi:hypothetical protein
MKMMKFFTMTTVAKACKKSRKLMEAKLEADGDFVQ